MALYEKKSSFTSPNCYISILKQDENSRENIRIQSNKISILNESGQILQQLVPDAKILPLNLHNNQMNERTLLSSIDNVLLGQNLTVFYLGTLNSGKQRLFDGAKNQSPLAVSFYDRVQPLLQKKFREWEVRMKIFTIINENIYDCLSQNKYALVRIKQNNPWEGPQIAQLTTNSINNMNQFNQVLKEGLHHKNKLIFQFKQLYTAFLILQIIHESQDKQKKRIISKVQFIEIPGIESLGQQNQQLLKIKQSNKTVRSLLGFTSMINQLAKDSESVPYYEVSNLSWLMKQIIGANSLISVFFTLRMQDFSGSLTTLKFLKPFNCLKQYPIINQSYSFGYLCRLRVQNLNNTKLLKPYEKQNIESEFKRIQNQNDYQRILQKYTDLKNKYSTSLRKKTEAQLELIKSQEQKLQVGKALVQTQIQNTKLLQKMHDKDHQQNRKIIERQNKLNEQEYKNMSNQGRNQELSRNLEQVSESKRDLQVEFIALKRNFILQQKQIKIIKQDNKNLGLQLLNVSNQNQKLRQGYLIKQNYKKNDIELMQKQKERKNQFKQQQQTIHYLKNELEKYKQELVQLQMNGVKQNGGKNGNLWADKNYDRLNIQNQNMELNNKLKLMIRKNTELNDKIQYYTEQCEQLQIENKKNQQKQHQNTRNYRQKLQQLNMSSNQQNIMKELKENFRIKETENMSKMQELKKNISLKKAQVLQMKTYIRQLKNLVEQWGPKGIQIPEMVKYRSMDLEERSVSSLSMVQQLRIRNSRLQEELQRVKRNSNLSKVRPQQKSIYRSSQVSAEMNYLKNSSSNVQLQNLRSDYTKLNQQNKKLTAILKDGNKMQINELRQQNEFLQKEMKIMKNNLQKQGQLSSISPSTNNNAKLQFYDKHMKKLQKQRTQLLSRCVVAEQQVKNMLQHVKKNNLPK